MRHLAVTSVVDNCEDEQVFCATCICCVLLKYSLEPVLVLGGSAATMHWFTDLGRVAARKLVH